MGYNQIEVAQAASQAARKLEESGAIPRIETTAILPKTSYVLELENGYMQKSFDDAHIDIVPGKTYTVEWNGVAYSCVCEECDAGGMGAYGLGNTAMIGGTRNEGPFLIMYLFRLSTWGIIDTETAPQYEPITVTVGIATETIHPIAPKFLPEDTLDLDEYGVGETIFRLVADGGGGTVADTDATAFWTKYREIKPTHVSLMYMGTPVQIVIVNKILEQGYEFFAFKAILEYEDVGISEVIVAVSYAHYPTGGSGEISDMVNVTVVM